MLAVLIASSQVPAAGSVVFESDVPRRDGRTNSPRTHNAAGVVENFKKDCRSVQGDDIK